MKRRFLIFAAAVLCFVSCGNKEPQYANRAEKIVAEMHNPNSKYVVVACHRGDWRNYPENSIPAIESIIRMGADIMELDLKLTRTAFSSSHMTRPSTAALRARDSSATTLWMKSSS